MENDFHYYFHLLIIFFMIFSKETIAFYVQEDNKMHDVQ